MQREQTGTRGADKKKTFGDYTKKHQQRIRGQLKTDCENSLTFLGIHDFVATEVKVFNFSTDEFETFHLVDSGMENSVVGIEEDKDIINLLLYTKDRFGLSNQAYHELSMVSFLYCYCHLFMVIIIC